MGWRNMDGSWNAFTQGRLIDGVKEVSAQ